MPVFPSRVSLPFCHARIDIFKLKFERVWMEIIRVSSKTPEENEVKRNPIITNRFGRNRHSGR
jgi:hypothetical protein